MSLAQERCEVCREGMPHLDDAGVAALITEIHSDWDVVGGHEKLRRRMKTSDFGESMALRRPDRVHRGGARDIIRISTSTGDGS